MSVLRPGWLLQEVHSLLYGCNSLPQHHVEEGSGLQVDGTVR